MVVEIGEIGSEPSATVGTGGNIDITKISIFQTPLLAIVVQSAGVAHSLYSGALSISTRANNLTDELLDLAKKTAVNQQNSMRDFIASSTARVNSEWLMTDVARAIQDRAGDWYAWGQTQVQATSFEMIVSCLHNDSSSVGAKIRAFLCEKTIRASR
jgi:hypothetical protein